MGAKARREKSDIENDLYQICKELEQISVELKGIKGVGAEYCSKKLLRVSEQYKKIIGQLNRI